MRSVAGAFSCRRSLRFLDRWAVLEKKDNERRGTTSSCCRSDHGIGRTELEGNSSTRGNDPTA